MEFVEKFYSQIVLVFNDGVLGISLGNLSVILLSIIFALLVRSIVAKLIVNKVKKIVLKTGNKIDNQLFEALEPPFRLLPIDRKCENFAHPKQDCTHESSPTERTPLWH